MIIDSINMVIYTMFFVIPGFIIAETINSIIPSKRRSDAEKLLLYLGYSILNFGCWLWLFICATNNLKDKTSLYWLVIAALALITGFLTGCVISFFKIHNPIKWVMKKIKIQVANPIPTAWEYKFSQLTQGRYLTVCLEDGTVIRGAFYNKSLASSDMENMDLFLEEVYMIDNGKWKAVKGSDGVWISSNSIKWISFLKEEGIFK
ncbi:MAG: hypothetical protein IJS61_01775 [Firmicutes bacterium]|nr:hypothetical protein [Bacillota bacterium]